MFHVNCMTCWFNHFQISYADYVLFEELDIAMILDPNALKAFPTLTEFHHRMENRPHLKVPAFNLDCSLLR